MALLDERLAPILAESAAERVTGWSAVDYLIDVLGRERLPHGRFGEPRVFVGTTSAAAGLSFTAVRILVWRKAYYRGPHMMTRLCPTICGGRSSNGFAAARPTSCSHELRDRVLEDLHGFYRVVAACTGRLRLSAPRQWVDRSEREVSGAMLEVAAALSRPPATGGAGVEQALADCEPITSRRRSWRATRLPPISFRSYVRRCRSLCSGTGSDGWFRRHGVVR